MSELAVRDSKDIVTALQRIVIVTIKNGVVTQRWPTHYLVVAITAMIGIATYSKCKNSETIPPLSK